MFKDIDYTDISIYKEGKLEGKLEDVKAMLLEGLGVDVIARITKLSIEHIENIAKETP